MPVAPVPSPQAIFDDRAASYWLKDALKTALERDAVDAARDAELLAAVLRARIDDLLGRSA